MKNILSAVLAIALISLFTFPAMAQEPTDAELQASERVADMIGLVRGLVIPFETLDATCEKVFEIWNAEQYGGANALTQAMVDATEFAGTPVARVTNAVTQCAEYLTWYTDGRVGELRKAAHIK